MSRLIAFAAFGLAGSLGIHRAEAASYVVWQGQAVITAATPACSATGVERARIAVGSTLRSVVRPRLLASNGNDSRIAFTHAGQSQFALDLAGGLTIAGTGTYAAYGVTPNGVFKTNVGGQYQAFALTPASPTVATEDLALTGTIANFMFISGCTVSFHAGYALRP